MKIDNKMRIVAILLFMIFALGSFNSGVNAEVTQTVGDVAREDIVWATSYWAAPVDWNPYFWDACFGTFFMYQTLFDINYETGNVEGYIGETMAWADAGETINIKLRSEAKWSDGKPITFDDVNFTYWHLCAPYRLEGFADRVVSITNTSMTDIVVTLDPAYKYSRLVWEGFIGGYPIAPKHIWKPIMEAQFDINDPDAVWDFDFANNWLEEGFKESDKVSSGPYVPYFVADTLDREIYKRDDDWWGNSVFGKPDAPYIGHIGFGSNLLTNTAFRKNEIDWYGGYYPYVWELLDNNPNCHLWSDSEPWFYPYGGIIELSPNHLRFPFDQKWLRQAMAYAIDYDEISVLSASGYLKQASPGFLDSESPSQGHLFSSTVNSTYAVEYDPDAAIAILKANCFNVTDTNGNTQWYTKDAPATLNLNGSEGLPVVDELGGQPGINVKLESWQINVVNGYSDTMIQAQLISGYLEDIFIRKCGSRLLEEGAFVDKFENMDYDLMANPFGYNELGTPYTALNSLAGPAGAWVNFTGWYSPEYSAKMEEFELTQENSTQAKTVAGELQELLADNTPAIPIAPNGYWYGYNDYLWSGFPSATNNYIHQTAPWEIAHIGCMQSVIINLKSTGATATPWSFEFAMLVFLAIGVYVSKKRRN